MPSTCGLSTFLMLINPEINLKFKKFLNSLYDEIEFLAPKSLIKRKNLNEFKWSIALDYLLLKSLGENDLTEELKKKIPILYEDYKFTFSNDLKKKVSNKLKVASKEIKGLFSAFYKSNLVNPYILKRSLLTMRKNLELRVLFVLFGGKFHHQEHESLGPYGTIYFNKEDFVKDSKVYKNKISLMTKHLKNKKINGVSCIALNKRNHWVAIYSIKDNIVYYNDPRNGRTGRLKVNKNIPQSYLFYCYSHNIESAIVLKKHIKSFLISETERELILLKELTKKIIEKYEEKPDIKGAHGKTKIKTKEIESQQEKNSVVSKEPEK